MDTQTSSPSIRGYDSFEVRLGDELRGERATLGKSLLDVQRDLRIKAAYIAAIENCDPEVFPNKGFVAGYVRSYARYLELDPEEVFARFCQEAKFDGVNADLTGHAKKSSGQTVLSGPVRVDRDDPLFRSFGGAPAVNSGWLQDFSFSALGSLLVLIGLISGLVFGGLHVLRDIQRVEIEPVGQRPAPLAEISDIVAPGLDTETVLPETDRREPAIDDQELARLYLPRALENPVVVPRDGPILSINPDRPSDPTADEEPADALEAGLSSAGAAFGAPVVREEPSVTTINVVAQRPAWIRIYEADGTILFEKILDQGEVYTVPVDANGPLLRAGNAGSVFVAVDDQLYGPIGDGTGVAKDISLLPGNVTTAFAGLEEVPDVMQAGLQASLEAATGAPVE